MNRLGHSQCGAALLTCTLLLVIVLLAMSASLRAARLHADISLAQADIQIARDAAEQALARGQRSLKQSVLAPPLEKSDNGTEPDGAKQANLALSRAGSAAQGADDRHHYRIDLLWAANGKRVSRITATGTGRRSTTHVSLQSDVEVTLCDGVSAPSAPSAPSVSSMLPMPSADVSPPCAVEIRQISWRELEGS